MTDATTGTVTCHKCLVERESKLGKSGEPRLPAGWKRHQGKIWCRKCWETEWVIRAVTIPVAGPIDAGWADLRAALKTCWSASTRVANWTVAELAKQEPPRLPGDEKIPPVPKLYLYPGARALAPEMDPQSVTALLSAVERKYRARRLAAIWRRDESLPSYRYPVPYPVHNQGWRMERDANGQIIVSVRLAGQPWRLRLRVGHQFRRQIGMAAGIADGRYLQGELSIFQRRVVATNDHRPNGAGHAPSRLLVKMVAWMPKREPRPSEGTLYVRTAGESLWVYHVGESGEPRHYHADQVRRWVGEHQWRLARLSDDTKREKRWPNRSKRGMAQRREALTRKQHRRLDTWTHEATAMLAGYAERRRVSRVEYDDTDRSYVPSLPWHQLRERLSHKLAERRIELVITGKSGDDASDDASGDVTGETP